MTHPPHSKKAALLVAAACAALAPAPARAEPPLRVRLGEASLVVPTSLLDGAVDVDRTRQVTLRGAVGTRTTTQGGTSALRLAQLMDVPPASVTSVQVQTLTGSGFTPEVSITGDEVRDGFSGDPLCASCQATFDHLLPPNTVNFFRPMRNGTDDNDVDLVRPRKRQSLYVRFVTTAPTIGAGLIVSDPTPRSDQTIDLQATAPAGAEVTWYFGDGTMGTGAQVTKRYAAGSWPLAAMSHDGTGFGVASTVLRVKAPPTLDPSRDKDSGLSGDVPTPTPRADTSAGSRGRGAGTGAGSGTGQTAGTNGTAKPATTPVSASAAQASPSSTADVSGTVAAATPPPGSPAAATPVPSPPPAPASAATGGKPISGQLVSGGPKPRSLTAAITAADALARDPSPAADAPEADSASAPLAGSVAACVLLLGLLAGGAITEVRRSRRAAVLGPSPT